MPRIALSLGTAMLAWGCNQENAYVPPPPPKVDVALPVKQTVTRYLTATGSTAAVNSTTLVARVQGFIQSIDYKDGDTVTAGQRLFLIEPQPYQLALEQAQATKAGSDATVKQTQAEYKRQSDLAAKSFATQANLDSALAARDSAVATQQTSQANIEQAQLNLSYTEVKAPFDGIVTARQVSMGQLVGGNGTPTTLATVVELQPIYVNFNVSEQDVQRIRAGIRKRGLTHEELKLVPVEVGLQTEEGYPHKGTLDYAAPTITAATGTLPVRAVLPNADTALLPGYFVRVRVPLAEQPDMLLVPDRAVGSDQSGRYLLVAGKDDVVEQRKVQIGQLVGELRVIETGIQPEDRIVVSGILNAVPGQKVSPQMQTISVAASDGATP